MDSDRSSTGTVRSVRARLIASAAIAGAVGVVLFFPDRDDGSGAILGAIGGFIAAFIGLTAADHVRPLPHRSFPEYLRIAGLAVALGVALGIANLLANYAIALMDPAIYQSTLERWAKFRPWSMVVADPLMEEIAFRLLLMSIVAWIAARFTRKPDMPFYIALAMSGLLFGLVHILYSTPLNETRDLIHASAIVVKSGAGGVLFGWVFWRWGLPFSYTCHGTANLVHMLLAPVLF